MKCKQSEENFEKYKLSTSSLSALGSVSSVPIPPLLSTQSPPPLTPLLPLPSLTPLQSLSITAKVNPNKNQISNESFKIIKIEKDDEFILNEMQPMKVEPNDNYQFKMDEMKLDQSINCGLIKNELIINDNNINYNNYVELVNDYPSNTTSEKCIEDIALFPSTKTTSVTDATVKNIKMCTQIINKAIPTTIGDDAVKNCIEKSVIN